MGLLPFNYYELPTHLAIAQDPCRAAGGHSVHSGGHVHGGLCGLAALLAPPLFNLLRLLLRLRPHFTIRCHILSIYLAYFPGDPPTCWPLFLTCQNPLRECYGGNKLAQTWLLRLSMCCRWLSAGVQARGGASSRAGRAAAGYYARRQRQGPSAEQQPGGGRPAAGASGGAAPAAQPKPQPPTHALP